MVHCTAQMNRMLLQVGYQNTLLILEPIARDKKALMARELTHDSPQIMKSFDAHKKSRAHPGDLFVIGNGYFVLLIEQIQGYWITYQSLNSFSPCPGSPKIMSEPSSYIQLLIKESYRYKDLPRHVGKVIKVDCKLVTGK